MKKISILLTLIIIFSVLSLSVSAQGVGSPCTENTDCGPYSCPLGEGPACYNYYCGCGTPPVECTTPPSGLVSWWPGDGNADDIKDANPGALVGDTIFVAGKVGDAFSFDGNGDSVEVADAPNLNFPEEFAVDFWVKTTSSDDSGLVSKGDSAIGNSWYIEMLSSGILRAGLQDGPASFQLRETTQQINDGTYYHIALNIKGLTTGDIEIFINGVRKDTVDFSGGGAQTGFNSVESLFIAQRNFNGPIRFLEGDIDEVEIHDRALTPSEIQNIFNAGSSGKCKNNCGDGNVEPGEVCDDPDLDGEDCESIVGTGSTGTLSCNFDCLSFVTTGCTPATCTTPPTNLLSWWPGDGDATDFQGLNDGVLTGGTGFATGKVGQAFSLDGIDDYVEVPNDGADYDFDVTDSFSIDAWFRTIKPSGPQDTYAILSKEGSIPAWNLNIFPNNKLNCGVQPIDGGTFNAVSTGTYTDGKFHLAVCVVNRATNTLTLYVNGDEEIVTVDIPADASFVQLATNVLIGARSPTSPDRFFEGEIDEVEIYDRALTAQEVKDIFDAGTAGKCKQECGNNVVESPEECDGSDATLCPGLCVPPNGPTECMCPVCGNNVLEPGEECDDGNNNNGDGCSADCTIPHVEEFLFGMNLANNLLHNKILFLGHIVKESLFQLELKSLELNVAHNKCENVIFSLRVNKENFRYGKEEEFDAMVNKLILIFENNPSKYPNINTAQAQSFINAATTWNALNQFNKALACKCKAYKVLNKQTDQINCEIPPL